MATRAAAIIDELSIATANNPYSLLSHDLNVTNHVMADILDFLFQDLNEAAGVNLKQVKPVYT